MGMEHTVAKTTKRVVAAESMDAAMRGMVTATVERNKTRAWQATKGK